MRIVQVIIVAGVVAGVVRALSRGESTPLDVLRFRAPPGQDPAAVLGALRTAGFSAEPTLDRGETEVVIRCRPGDRERVRDVLHRAPIDMGGDPFDGPPVRFTDE